MQISVQELQENPKYILVKKLSLDDIVPFVFHQIRIWNASSVLFFFSVIISFFIMILTCITYLLSEGWVEIIRQGFFGFVLWPIILIPLHEFIHAFTYKLSGAPNIRLGVKPQMFLFYVSAENHVIGKKWFYGVAFTPFVLISIILVILFYSTSYPLSWSFLVCLFVHTTMCIGDFALAGFFMKYQGQEVYTYDDIENDITYFYVQKSDS